MARNFKVSVFLAKIATIFAIRIVRQLSEGEELEMKVKSVKRVGEEDVYNMTVEDTHDFIIQGGVISHNCDDLRYVCMYSPTPPRIIQEEEVHFFDPLNQYTKSKY